MKHNKKKEMKFINYRSYLTAIIVLAAGVIIFNIMYRVNTVFATSYSNTVYPHIVRVLGAICSVFPFSVFELMICLGILWLLFAIIRLIVYAIKYHSKAELFHFTYRLKKSLLNLACVVLAVLLVYSLNGGVNYYRLPFSVCANIRTGEYTNEQLATLCKQLISDANDYSEKIALDSNGHYTLSGIDERSEASDAMRELSDKYPCLTEYHPKPKPVFFSKVMSSFNISGVYSPFTTEANYNNDVTDVEKPYTMCHELSHLSGFMREDEANFIAYLGCMESDVPEFNYSGTMFALINVINEVYACCDYEVYKELYLSMNEQVISDLQFQSDYWEQYEDTVAASVSSSVNNTYLVTNGQSDGVRTYDHVTELLLAYYYN